MSKMNYANTVIYKIVHKDDINNENIYIGSTTNFMRMLCNHKDCSQNEKKNGYTDKKYAYIRDKGGWNNFNMIEIEKFPCNDGNEARVREEYYRQLFNAKLNTKKSFTTQQERLEQMKCYYMQHKGKMNEQMKNRYLKIKTLKKLVSNETDSKEGLCM